MWRGSSAGVLANAHAKHCKHVAAASGVSPRRTLLQHTLRGKAGKEPRMTNTWDIIFEIAVEVLRSVSRQGSVAYYWNKKHLRQYGKHMATNTHTHVSIGNIANTGQRRCAQLVHTMACRSTLPCDAALASTTEICTKDLYHRKTFSTLHKYFIQPMTPI